MTFSWKWLAVAAVLCLLAGVGMTSRYYSARVGTLERDLKTAQADAKASRAASATKSAELARVEAHYQKQSKDLANALKANPGWADSRVPDAVFDSLFGPGTDSPAR
ncbi:hypothetical protein LMG3458_02504 [Achromobacter deleyi]|uniref:I-spanin n=1 Tax=Achromobacter deleyi TaxID=1353891 RepID=A0A6S6ZZF8_9BURK|nr:hypothetical protein [Achromobacter deleyi]CAB3698201.1 hypothetical protein LMG3458_02504 [Achromobacter deleyi]